MVAVSFFVAGMEERFGEMNQPVMLFRFIAALFIAWLAMRAGRTSAVLAGLGVSALLLAGFLLAGYYSWYSWVNFAAALLLFARGFALRRAKPQSTSKEG